MGPWVHVEPGCFICRPRKSVDGAAQEGEMPRSWVRFPGWDGSRNWWVYARPTSLRQSSVSEEVRRKRCRSWDQVQLPDEAMNQLPLSYNGGEINNNKTLTITGVFYSQLVAVKMFFAGCFDRTWPCTNHTLVMLSNNASCFIPGWS